MRDGGHNYRKDFPGARYQYPLPVQHLVGGPVQRHVDVIVQGRFGFLAQLVGVALVGFHLNDGLVAAIGKLLVSNFLHLVVIQGNSLELVLHEVVQGVGGGPQEVAVQILGSGVGGRAALEVAQELSQRAVEAFFAQVAAQGVESQRAFGVVDVGLVFVVEQGQLAHFFGGPAAQVKVEGVAPQHQHPGRTVEAFQHQHREVFRHRFRHKRGALHGRAGNLMAPPLVGHLVGHHAVGAVHVVVVGAGLGDEAEAFGVGHGAGESLGKLPVARKLDDARLLLLVSPKLLAVVRHRGAHGPHHAVEVIRVGGVVVNLQVDAIQLFAPHLIAG